jgi:hypothetical protein
MIEQLARVFARFRELLAGGATAEARAEIERAAAGLGLPGKLAQALDDNSLLALLSVGGQPDVPKRVVVAESFVVDAIGTVDVTRKRRLLERALMLYGTVEGEGEALRAMGMEGRAEEIRALLP